MFRAARGLGLTCLVTAACLAGLAGRVRADDVEHRDFVIFVDDKEAGQSRITMIQKDDGTTHVTARAKVTVKLVFVKVFSYQVDSTEVWKNGQLVQLNSVATEDGKTTKVDVGKSGDKLLVRVNGGTPGSLNPEVWSSSYWKLADARYHNKTVPVLDADTGKELRGQLDFVGTEKLGAKALDCYHFRVTGIPVPIDLWFDLHHRLVRQEFTEQGHRTIVELIAVRR
jgi:hypothetical protein